MDSSYRKETNNKVKDYQFDDSCESRYGYPYEAIHPRTSQVAPTFDDTERRRFIGSDRYMVRTESVYEVVHPGITNGNSPMDNHEIVRMLCDQVLNEGHMAPTWQLREEYPPRSFAGPVRNQCPTSAVRPTWSRQYEPAPRSMIRHPESANPNWPTQDDSPPRSMLHPPKSIPQSELNGPKPSGRKGDWAGQEDTSSDVSNDSGKTKPNFSSGWYKAPKPLPTSTSPYEKSDVMKLVEEAKRRAYINEITPNPPQELQYIMHVVPAAPWSYYRPPLVLDSNQAVIKYNGIRLPNTFDGNP